MTRRRITREWQRTQRPQGVRRRRLPGFRWALFGLLLVGVFFIGRRTMKSGQVAEAPRDAAIERGRGGTLEEITKDSVLGQSLTIPIQDPIVLEADEVSEGSIAQETRDITISDGAGEATLEPLYGRHGSGSATVEYGGDTYRHVIVADVPDPAEGYYYEAWLIRSKPFDFISTGRLYQNTDDYRWYLLYEHTEDLRNYAKIVVTLEPEDGDPAPGDHVLEGFFAE